MSRLLFVRHGQASFLAADYDQLSSLGEEQARRLGEHWRAQGEHIDAFISGPARRQRATAELVAGAWAGRDAVAPAIATEPRLDEYPEFAIMRQCAPELVDRDATARQLLHEFDRAQDPIARQSAYQRLFERVARAWVRGELVLGELEPWAAFQARVAEAVAAIRARTGRGRAVAVVTSAGPVAQAARIALALGDETSLELAWSLRNTSVSEFLFSGERFSLSTFNALAHLPPEMWTYR